MQANANRRVFELHSEAAANESTGGVSALPWEHGDRLTRREVLAIHASDGVVRVRADCGLLERIPDSDPDSSADFGVAAVRLKQRSQLAIFPRRPDILVNGLPALSFGLLAVKDSVAFGGSVAHVTERIYPFVGRPSGDLLGKPCGYCKVPVTEETVVVTCGGCGVPYHREETLEASEKPEAERLHCFRAVRNCLGVGCRRRLGLEEQLLWEPGGL